MSSGSFWLIAAVQISVRTHCSPGVGQMDVNARNVASAVFASVAGKLNSRAIAVVAKPGLLNTIFDSTKLHLANWFLGIYLVSQITRFRVEEAVTDLTPHRPGRAQFRHSVPHVY